MSEELKELVSLFGVSKPVVSVCGDNLSEVLAEAKRQEKEFWAWVSEEVKQARPSESLGDVVAWLERERARAENARFSYSLRNEPLKAAYEEGRLEVINEVLRRLRRVGA
ncbi:hypothetical protein [Thermococcus thioreducens]|uniref:Uncharacterized protein n=1 Tax=Thermococcus thioreducens TaxID=277988 RepID=A0A0Q2XPJ9_9EURY|nr:hypothetical protein [Thermococcus thioreducens]ASJ13383.1 hypothetical protein A3L14_11045 [Thermococcus thioreducens]KQH83212.1 hypothetical protein AMR53_00570 [Thermococcus thioreducens]SEW23594.1 hypothetical protein SAMN05216170_2318 [Thermococcus thioreducens]